jgi:hypothetical protein
MLPSIAERMQDEKQPGSAVEALYAWPWFAAMCTPRADQAVAPSAFLRRGLIGAKTAALLTQLATVLCTTNRILQ